ncbi:hypothetical protein M885DRAFT_507238 [Pelagophyceae sp. CCMP2097]|nr:hypothetical protein M885DRAFT_507238 [Pelagophyceae sp. CCMP2097]
MEFAPPCAPRRLDGGFAEAAGQPWPLRQPNCDSIDASLPLPQPQPPQPRAVPRADAAGALGDSLALLDVSNTAAAAESGKGARASPADVAAIADHRLRARLDVGRPLAPAADFTAGTPGGAGVAQGKASVVQHSWAAAAVRRQRLLAVESAAQRVSPGTFLRSLKVSYRDDGETPTAKKTRAPSAAWSPASSPGDGDEDASASSDDGDDGDDDAFAEKKQVRNDQEDTRWCLSLHAKTAAQIAHPPDIRIIGVPGGATPKLPRYVSSYAETPLSRDSAVGDGDWTPSRGNQTDDDDFEA